MMVGASVGGGWPVTLPLAGALDLTCEFREKKRAELSAPPNARKEKKPYGLKDKNLEANNRFLNQEGS
ncbi:hypothetical protein [Aeromonas veronii]|uniref:hypothetical protein n=1 Tax=Aeromonas veronii TaxID=654 RepID=UPI003D1D70A3